MNAELLSFNTILSPWGHIEETRVYKTDRGEIEIKVRYHPSAPDRFEDWDRVQEEFRRRLETEYEKLGV